MHILLVNDDGIHSPGLRLLAQGLQGAGHQVTVVAPDRERSAVGHGITLREPLFVGEQDWAGIPAYSCSGTPADCTQLGLLALTDTPVDLVVSGPNRGVNLAGDLQYSGTVAAALEAVKKGRKALALSAPKEADPAVVVRVFLTLLGQLDLSRDVRHMLNLNVPALPYEQILGVKWAPQGSSLWMGGYEERRAPDGRRYFWCAAGPARSEQEDSDFSLLQRGYVTVTPLTDSLTDPAGFSGKTFTL